MVDLSESNVIRTHNHLIHKQTFEHLAKLGKCGLNWLECGFTLKPVRDMIITYSQMLDLI